MLQDIRYELKKQIIEELNIEDIKPEDIQDDAPLFGDGLGLDSIDALELVVLLEKYYGVKAEFKDPSIRNKKITASIPVENLDMIALILSKTVHTKIKHLNDRLIIQ